MSVTRSVCGLYFRWMGQMMVTMCSTLGLRITKILPEWLCGKVKGMWLRNKTLSPDEIDSVRSILTQREMTVFWCLISSHFNREEVFVFSLLSWPCFVCFTLVPWTGGPLMNVIWSMEPTEPPFTPLSTRMRRCTCSPQISAGVWGFHGVSSVSWLYSAIHPLLVSGTVINNRTPVPKFCQKANGNVWSWGEQLVVWIFVPVAQK